MPSSNVVTPQEGKVLHFYYFYGFANGYDLLNWHTGNIKVLYTNCN